MNREAVAKVLNDAADHMEKVGLHKGDFYRAGEKPEISPCCTMGAIRHVSGFWGARPRDAEYLLTLDAEGVFWEALDAEIAAWNDKPSQRKDRVVAKLRRVAREVLEG